MESKSVQNISDVKKSDVKVTVDLNFSGLEIEIVSSVKPLFESQINNAVLAVLKEENIQNAKISIVDNGALDFAIRARTKTAIQRARSTDLSVKKPIRSMLFCPANNPKFYHTSPYYKPDCIIFDLEDSVPIDDKDAARNMLSEAFKSLDFDGIEIYVRVNSFKSPFFDDDIYTTINAGIKNIRIPMCEHESEIIEADKKISEIEKICNVKLGTTKIQIGVETPLGLLNIQSLINASDRVISISFGAEDYTACLGVERTKNGDEILHARSTLVNVASAYNIEFTDAVWKDINDQEGFVNETNKMKSLGIFSKSLIHPSQIELLHDALKPTDQQISNATKIINASQKANISSGGVIAVDGNMVDMPVIKRARKIINLADD